MEQHKTKHALILAAGMGKRLGNLTGDRTKCMVRFLDSTILERMLGQLERHGIERVTIVTGYFGHSLRERIGDSFGGLSIRYFDNPIYDKTNNIYSLYIARHALTQEDTLLLESDLVFEDSVLERILSDPRPDLAVVAKYRDWMDGTVLTLDGEDRILGFIPKSRFDRKHKDDYFKTVNIYRFSRDFSLSYYVPFLEAYCTAMGHNEYYEQVLRIITHLDHSRLKALRLDQEKWYEIDDVSDLANAETLLAPETEAYTAYTSRYGGYWRFPMMLDYCYLVNPFFPTPELVAEIKGSLETLLTQYPSGQEVNRKLAARMFGVQHDRILVGNGAAELIQALQASFGGTTGVIRPSFEEYAQRIPENRLRVFEATQKDYAYSVDELIEFAQHEKLDRLILVNPDNPSGHYISAREVERLANALNRRSCQLLLDESFVDFAEEQISFLSAPMLKTYENLIVVKSISKSYGVPGLRLGVVASADRQVIEACKSELSIWNINSFGEFFMQIIGKYDKEYREACLKLIAERKRFASHLAELPFLNVFSSQANYVFCEVLKPETPCNLARVLLNRHDILIKDCSGKPGIDGPFIRIAVRTPQDNDRLLDALDGLTESGRNALRLSNYRKKSA